MLYFFKKVFEETGIISNVNVANEILICNISTAFVFYMARRIWKLGTGSPTWSLSLRNADFVDKHLLQSRVQIMKFEFWNVSYFYNKYYTARNQKSSEVRLFDTLMLPSASFSSSLPSAFISFPVYCGNNIIDHLARITLTRRFTLSAVGIDIVGCFSLDSHTQDLPAALIDLLQL